MSTTSQYANRLDQLIQAGFQAIRTATKELRRLHAELSIFAEQTGLPVIGWELQTGPTILHPGGAAPIGLNKVLNSKDFFLQLAAGDSLPFLLVVHDGHMVLSDSPHNLTEFRMLHTKSAFVHAYEENGQLRSRTHPILFVQATDSVHPEIDHLIEPLLLPLATADQIAVGNIEYLCGSLPEGETGFEAPASPELRHQIAEACSGLLDHQVNDILSLALNEHGKFCPEMLPQIQHYRAELIGASGVVSLYQGTDTFADIGGLEALKSFCLKALRRRQNAKARPRGLLLLGVPGTGKSMLAKALGTEVGRPTLSLDFGRLMGSLLGQSEANLREALAIADSLAPAILFVDECEKSLSGASSSGQTDGGVTARIFGAFLTWMNDHKSDTFVIMTANSITNLPPEFSRAERFDGVFFLDLPGSAQKSRIWDLYIQKYGLDPAQPRPRDIDWTGAEIASCCRLAELMELSLIEAAQNVVPVAITAGESIEALRNWASGRCLSAEVPGIYTKGATATASSPSRPGRNLGRGSPGVN